MRTNAKSRLLALVLAVIMVVSMLPTFASAATTYTKITSRDELTTGKYVMVTSNGYAPTYLEGKWVLSAKPTVSGTTLTDPSADMVWTLTVNGSNVQLTDKNGVTVAPKGGNNNGIQSGTYNWAVSCTNETFQFKGQGTNTVTLALNATPTSGENRIRAYNNSTLASDSNYYSSFTLYKMDEAAPLEPVATPTFSITEEDVLVGTEVTISCATEGATIYYSYGNTGTYTEYTGPIEINGDIDIAVYATKEGMTDSETHVQVYTAYKLVEKFVPVTDLSVIETGDELVIYNPGSGMACSADAIKTYYRAATALTPDESGNFVDVDSKLRWTVTADSGVYTFATQDGKMLSVNAGKNSLPLDKVNDTWTITAATTANCYYIINANCNTLYIEYYSQHTEFSTHIYSSSNETIYAMGLYRMTEVWEPVGPAPVGETVATPTATPTPGEVESGTQVSFACATADAVISYKIGDGAYTTYTGPVTITEDTTFTVKAAKSGMTDSAEAVFEYTIKEAFSLKEGDKVVIYNPANLKALSQN